MTQNKTLRDEISEKIWLELNDEAFFLPTEKLNKTADAILTLFDKAMDEVIGGRESLPEFVSSGLEKSVLDIYHRYDKPDISNTHIAVVLRRNDLKAEQRTRKENLLK